MPDFDNSKVRDEKGKLKTVYHGSPHGISSQFSKEHQSDSEWLMIGPGFYFSEKKDYAELASYGAKQKLKSGVKESDAKKRIIEAISSGEAEYGANAAEIAAQVEAFINVNGIGSIPDNYLVGKYGLDDLFEAAGPNVLRAHLAIVNPFDADISRFEGMSYKELVDKYGSKKKVQEVLQAAGYDGMTHLNNEIEGDESAGQRHWVAFEPDQIRSADASKQDVASSRAVLKSKVDSQSNSNVAPVATDGRSPADTTDKQDITKPLENVQTQQANESPENTTSRLAQDTLSSSKPSDSQSVQPPVVPVSSQGMPEKIQPSDQSATPINAPSVSAPETETPTSAPINAPSSGTESVPTMLDPSHVRQQPDTARRSAAPSASRATIAYEPSPTARRSAEKSLKDVTMAMPVSSGHEPPIGLPSGSGLLERLDPGATGEAEKLGMPVGDWSQDADSLPDKLAASISPDGQVTYAKTTEERRQELINRWNTDPTINPALRKKKRKKNGMAPSASQSSGGVSGDAADVLADASGIADGLIQAGGNQGGETWHQELLDAITKLTEAIEKLTDQKTKGEGQSPGPQKDGSFVTSFGKSGGSPIGKAVGAGIDSAVRGDSSGDMMKTVTDVLLREVMRGAMAAL